MATDEELETWATGQESEHRAKRITRVVPWLIVFGGVCAVARLTEAAGLLWVIAGISAAVYPTRYGPMARLVGDATEGLLQRAGAVGFVLLGAILLVQAVS